MNPIKGKMFVICIPGRTFSADFMLNLMDLLMFISSNEGKFRISVQYHSVVNASRCKCLGVDVRRGKKQKPFDGMPYDYLLWIDSDVIYKNENFVQLLKLDKDIASGWYVQPGQAEDGSFISPVVESFDHELFKKEGYYKFESAKELEARNKPFKVEYTGFGWVLIKHGVFEKMDYPWFAPRLLTISEDIQEMSSEDVAFCMDAKNAGFEIWLDPKCRVGHEKQFVI